MAHAEGNERDFVKDTARVQQLLKESKSFFVGEPDKAIRMSIEAKDLAEAAGFAEGKAYALKNIGIAYYYKSNYVEALQNYEQSLEIFKSLNDNRGIANLLSNIGVIYYDRGDVTKALDYHLQSLRYSELSKDKLRVLTALNNIGAVYNNNEQTHDKALEYYLMALPICEELGDTHSYGTIAVNVGTIYFGKNDNKKALFYFNRALKAYGNTEEALNAYNAISKLYLKEKRYDLALRNNDLALNIAQKLNSKISMMQTLVNRGNVYKEMGNTAQSIGYYRQAEQLGVEIEANTELKDLYKEMALAYSRIQKYDEAFRYQTLYSDKSADVYNADQDKKLSALQFGYDLEKKQNEINLLTKDKQVQDAQLNRQKLFKNALSIGFGMVLIIVLVLYRDYRIKIKTNRLLDKQKMEIESLLLNILPSEVANELQNTGRATPRNYESASILFTDFKSFTSLSENMPPDKVVEELNTCFMAFDEITEKYNLEKIKTIGDSYMCAGGIPTPYDGHIFNIVKASLEMQEFIHSNNQRRREANLPAWEIRIGINVGPIVAGVVGKRKYAYDIWGSAVNIASRMESNGMPGQVNISSSVYELIKEKYACIYRGKIYAKNVGEIDMYFIDHEIENFEGFRNFEEVQVKEFPRQVTPNLLQ